jgi:uncharacterized lipoprotein
MNLFNVKSVLCLGVVACVLSACTSFRASGDRMSIKNWQSHAHTIATIEPPSSMQQAKMQGYYVVPEGKVPSVPTTSTPVFLPPGSQPKHK